MTITYTAEVATSSFACFLKLLVRWRGSIYKLMWKEFLVFLTAFYTLNFVYRFALKDNQKRIFEKITRYCEQYNNLIPVAFVLGFYVSIVISRWWAQFNVIPWPDRMALFVTANIQGQDERGRLMRRTLMRYLCLSYVLTMSSISPVIKKRFPTNQHIVEAGFMNPNEEAVFSSIDTPHNKYFVPLAWATSLVTRARKENRIKDDFAVKTLIDEINAYRGSLGGVFCYDWISIPLVYTQVVTLAVYSFFLSCLMGRQLVENSETADVYVPVFTFLQFFFYMGWLKVAESLVNPFGEDDDDFDINTCIDRNLQVSYLVVDEMHQEHPELIKDQYWDEINFELPYTEAALPFKDVPHLGSAMHINVTPKDAEFVNTLSSIVENPEEGIGIPTRYVRSNSRQEKNRFFNRPFLRSFSNMSRKSQQGPQGQVSDSATALQETPVSQYPQQFEGGSNRMLCSEEDIFQMSDLDSVPGKQSNLDVSSVVSVVCDVDTLDGRNNATGSNAQKSNGTGKKGDILSQTPRNKNETELKSNDTGRKGGKAAQTKKNKMENEPLLTTPNYVKSSSSVTQKNAAKK